MRSKWLRVALLLFVFVATALVWGQPQPGLPLPRIDFSTPYGAKVGTTVEVAFTGTDLDDLDSLWFSHPGIKSEKHIPPEPKPDEKDPKKDGKEAKKAEMKKADPKGPPPAKFNVTVGGDVPPGQYDVRVVNKFGISNPRVFTVGDLHEILEKEGNNDIEQAQKIELGTTVNGVINQPTDVDFYQFAGKKGQRVIVHCATSSIDSRAKPLVEMWTLAGKQLTSRRNYQGNDALADVTLPDDGEYLVRVGEFTYTSGGPQYFYRLSVSVGPWVDAVFPSVVEPGKPTRVMLYGRNLPGGQVDPGMLVEGQPVEKAVVTITPPTDPLAAQSLRYGSRIEPKSSGLDGFEYRVKGPNGTSNPVLIAFAHDQMVVEKENNDKPENAEEVPAPCEVAGRIDKRGDVDWYTFTAKKDQVFWIELFADRLGSASVFTLTVRNLANKGQDMATLDDTPETLSQTQFYTRHGDPAPYKFTAPADGKYQVKVACLESNFFHGPRANYRLRIGSEQPDFRVVVMPPSNVAPHATVLGASGIYALDVFVWRMDGFKEPITLSAEGLPPGVTCPPQTLAVGSRAGALVLSADENAAPFTGTFKVKAMAKVNGKEVVRAARAATITWPGQQGQNTPLIARLDDALVLAVREKAPFKIAIEPENAFLAKKEEKLLQPLMMKQGEKLTVPFKVARIHPDAKQPITLQQVATQQNMQQAPVVVNNGQALPPVAPDKNDGTFVVEAKNNAPPGVYTVVLRANSQMPYAKTPDAKQKPNVQITTSTMPLTVTVLPLSVAKVTLDGPKGNLKQGTPSEVTVKVERQFEYAGEFKLKLVLPKDAKGVTADEVTIPAGQNQAKLILKVADDAPAGPMQNLLVQATGVVEGKVPIAQEAKFNVNIEKTPKKEEPKKERKKEEPKKEEKKEPKKEEPKKDEKKEPKKEEKK